MVGKLIDLLKNPENLSIFLFLMYVVALMHFVLGYFIIGWVWRA